MAESIETGRQEATVEEAVRIFREIATRHYLLELDFNFHADADSVPVITYTAREVVVPMEWRDDP